MRPRVRRRLTIAVLVTGLSTTVIQSACSRAPAQALEPVAVATAPARLERLRDSLTAVGTVVPATAADVTLFAPENGRLISLPHAEGDVVQAGDLLVQYDIPSITQEITSWQAEVAQAASKVEAAKRNLARLSGLAAQGLIPRNQLEAAQGAVVDAQSSQTAAQGQLDRATVGASRAKVLAKFPGTIVKLWHAEGDNVTASSNDPVLRIVDPTRLQVAVPLSIVELERVVVGQPAVVRVPGRGDQPANVTTRPTPANANVTSVEIRLSFAQPTALPLDSTVEVEIQLDERKNALVVPRAAVQKDDDGVYVMVAGADARVHRHDVRLGLVTRDLAQITSGVALGERVVTSTASQLIDGMTIRIDR